MSNNGSFNYHLQDFKRLLNVTYESKVYPEQYLCQGPELAFLMALMENANSVPEAFSRPQRGSWKSASCTIGVARPLTPLTICEV